MSTAKRAYPTRSYVHTATTQDDDAKGNRIHHLLTCQDPNGGATFLFARRLTAAICYGLGAGGIRAKPQGLSLVDRACLVQCYLLASFLLS